MLGAGASGARQLRGRISVMPGGHCSPGWICVPRAPPGPRLDGCCCGGGVCERSVPLVAASDATAMTTDQARMEFLTGVNWQSAARAYGSEPQRLSRLRFHHHTAHASACSEGANRPATAVSGAEVRKRLRKTQKLGS